MKKDNKNKKNNFFINILKDKSLLILTIILIVLSVIIVALKISRLNNLDIESDKVVGLHNYFNSEKLSDCDGLFTYSDGLINYDKLSNETRLCIAYQKSNFKDIETGTIKKDKKNNTCTKEGMVFRLDNEQKECSYTKVSQSIVRETYKEIFGQDLETQEKFKIDNLNICYLKDDYYYCGLSETFTYTLGNESVIYRVINKAVEKGDDIIIYDYFVKINDNKCYKNYTTSSINDKCSKKYEDQKDINFKFIKKYGTAYKHIFRQNDNKTYYWVSSEPIK